MGRESTEHQHLKDRRILSFGGRQGRAPSKAKQALLDTWLPKLEVSDLQNLTIPEKLTVEIGFGAGEHLAHRAKNKPNMHFIGSEVFDQGIAQAVQHIADADLSNVQLYLKDGRELIDALTDNSVDCLYVLHPDPWPKRRHHKRRLINQSQLADFHRVLKPEGELCIATDHEDYTNWIAVQLTHFKGFLWQARSSSDFKTPREGHIQTRYEAKGRKDGSTIVYLRYKKQSRIKEA